MAIPSLARVALQRALQPLRAALAPARRWTPAVAGALAGCDPASVERWHPRPMRMVDDFGDDGFDPTQHPDPWDPVADAQDSVAWDHVHQDQARDEHHGWDKVHQDDRHQQDGADEANRKASLAVDLIEGAVELWNLFRRRP